MYPFMYILYIYRLYTIYTYQYIHSLIYKVNIFTTNQM